VVSAVNGYNATVFAYGCTGSGKTHTIAGSHSSPGVIPRAITRLFQVAQQLANQHEELFVLINMSYVELYNNQFRDLLTSKEDDVHHKIDLHTTATGDVFLSGSPNLRMPVNSVNQALRLVTKGTRNRVTGSTDCNQHSSRSHSILTFHIESRPVNSVEPSTVAKLGKLHIVDLAGSERLGLSGVSGGSALTETQNINLSLATLGNVLSSLSRLSNDDKKGMVPYRDSKLTFLLRDSLGGNSKTIMIANIRSPSEYRQQTLMTLLYASRTKKIQNRIQINTDTKGDSKAAALVAEVERLKFQLKQRELDFEILSRSSSGNKNSTEEKERMKKLAELAKENELEKNRLEMCLKQVVHNHTSTLAVEQHKYSALQGKLQEYKTVFYEQRIQIETLKESISALTRKTAGEKEVLEMKQVMEDLTTALERRRAEIEEKDAIIRKGKSEYDGLVSQFAVTQKKLLASQKELDKTTASSSIMLNQYEAFKAANAIQLDEAKNRRQIALDELARLKRAGCKNCDVLKNKYSNSILKLEQDFLLLIQEKDAVITRLKEEAGASVELKIRADEVSTMQRRVKQLVEQNNELINASIDANSIAKTLQRQRDDIAGKYDASKVEIEHGQKAMELLKKELHSKSMETTNLVEKIEYLKENSQAQTFERETETTRNQLAVGEATNAIKKLARNERNLHDKIMKMENDAERCDKEMQSMQEKLRQFEDREKSHHESGTICSQLRESLKMKENELLSLTGSLNIRQKELMEVSKVTRDLENKYSSLQVEFSSISLENAKLEHANQTLESKKKELQLLLDKDQSLQLREENSQLKNQLTENQSKQDTFKSTILHEIASIKSASLQKNEEWKIKYHQLEESSRASISSLHSQLENSKSINQKIQEQLRKDLEVIRTLENRESELNNQVDTEIELQNISRIAQLFNIPSSALNAPLHTQLQLIAKACIEFQEREMTERGDLQTKIEQSDFRCNQLLEQLKIKDDELSNVSISLSQMALETTKNQSELEKQISTISKELSETRKHAEEKVRSAKGILVAKAAELVQVQVQLQDLKLEHQKKCDKLQEDLVHERNTFINNMELKKQLMEESFREQKAALTIELKNNLSRSEQDIESVKKESEGRSEALKNQIRIESELKYEPLVIEMEHLNRVKLDSETNLAELSIRYKKRKAENQDLKQLVEHLKVSNSKLGKSFETEMGELKSRLAHEAKIYSQEKLNLIRVNQEQLDCIHSVKLNSTSISQALLEDITLFEEKCISRISLVEKRIDKIHPVVALLTKSKYQVSVENEKQLRCLLSQLCFKILKLEASMISHEVCDDDIILPDSTLSKTVAESSAALTSMVSRFQSSKCQFQSRIHGLQGMIIEFVREIIDVEKDIDEAQALHQVKSAIQNQMDSSTSKLAELDSKYQQLQKSSQLEMKELEGKYRHLSAKELSKKEIIDKLSSTITQFEERISNSEIETTNQASKIQIQNQCIGDLQLQKDELESQLIQYRQEMGALQIELLAISNSRDLLNEKLEDLNQREIGQKIPNDAQMKLKKFVEEFQNQSRACIDVITGKVGLFNRRVDRLEGSILFVQGYSKNKIIVTNQKNSRLEKNYADLKARYTSLAKTQKESLRETKKNQIYEINSDLLRINEEDQYLEHSKENMKTRMNILLTERNVVFDRQQLEKDKFVELKLSILNACLMGDMETLAGLLEGHRLDGFPSNDTFLPLHRAISGFHFHNNYHFVSEAIQLLVKHNSDTNARDQTGNTALHKAIQVMPAFAVLEIVQILINCGADVSIRNKLGDTPLHTELRRLRGNSLVIVKALVDAGANITEEDTASRVVSPKRLLESISQESLSSSSVFCKEIFAYMQKISR